MDSTILMHQGSSYIAHHPWHDKLDSKNNLVKGTGNKRESERERESEKARLSKLARRTAVGSDMFADAERGGDGEEVEDLFEGYTPELDPVGAPSAAGSDGEEEGEERRSFSGLIDVKVEARDELEELFRLFTVLRSAHLTGCPRLLSFLQVGIFGGTLGPDIPLAFGRR